MAHVFTAASLVTFSVYGPVTLNRLTLRNGTWVCFRLSTYVPNAHQRSCFSFRLCMEWGLVLVVGKQAGRLIPVLRLTLDSPYTQSEIHWDSNCDLVLQLSFHGACARPNHIDPDNLNPRTHAHTRARAPPTTPGVSLPGRDRQIAHMGYDDRSFGLTTVVGCPLDRVLHVGDHQVSVRES